MHFFLSVLNPSHVSSLLMLLRIDSGGGLSLVILFVVRESRPQLEADGYQRSDLPTSQSELRHTERNHLSFDQVCTDFCYSVISVFLFWFSVSCHMLLPTKQSRHVSRARHRWHAFPRWAQLACFPALSTFVMFSRARHGWHVFLR